MSAKKIFPLVFVLLIICNLLFVSCGSPETVDEPVVVSEVEVEEPSGKASEEDKAKPEEAASSDPQEEALAEGLPADPQKVAFSTADGVDLEGVFYPASTPSAPLIILMHWAPGDQRDWVEVAYWMQNRGLGEGSAAGDVPWMDPSWFPELNSAKSFNIFTFTFRSCEGGCKVFERENWYVDAQAAVEYAYQLEGIDRENIIMIGTSIGADGVADGCVYLNQVHTDACDGALSVSPGNYLTIDYEEMVEELGSASEPKPAWCLFAESDPESAAVCRDIDEENYKAYPYPAEAVFSNGHGMNLIAPGLEPDVLELILDFIELVS